jgi:hypothetical protein
MRSKTKKELEIEEIENYLLCKNKLKIIYNKSMRILMMSSFTLLKMN